MKCLNVIGAVPLAPHLASHNPLTPSLLRYPKQSPIISLRPLTTVDNYPARTVRTYLSDTIHLMYFTFHNTR